MSPKNVKSRDAFRTIGEVAEELGVPQHVLRFWESKFASIRPIKRGGGRRYYRREDVELLKSIRQFLHNEGYTIKGVQKLLRENGPGALRHSVSVVLVADKDNVDGDGAPDQRDGHPSTVRNNAGKPDSHHDRDDALSSILQQLESLRRELQLP